MQQIILLNMDPPEHTKLRGIVSRGFNPRAIGNLRQALTDRAERIVAAALETGAGDFVTDVAAELPLQAICELLGVPQEDRGKIFAWSNRMMGYDERTADEENDGMVAATEVLGYSLAMAEERRACPRDDIVTKLISAEIDGNQLTDDEFGFFVLMLAVAGNETTRNAIAHGMLAFLDHPGQWELFKASRPATAADEIVRWATPITVFQRTVTQDTTLGGHADQGGPAGRPVLPVGQLRRGGLHAARAVRHRPQPQSPPGVRRPRHALLPGRQPGQAGDRADLQRGRGRHAGHRQDRRPGPAALRVDQRPQEPPGQLPGLRSALLRLGGLRLLDLGRQRADVLPGLVHPG